MPGFKRLGQPFGDFNGLNRFGGGNARPGFNWIRSLTFEAGALISDPTGFDAIAGAGAGDLSVAAAAAIRGAFGYSVDIPNTNGRIGQIFNIANLKTIQLQFLLDPNSITMANGDAFIMARAPSSGGTGISFDILMQYTAAAGYALQVSARNNAGAGTVGGVNIIPDEACQVTVQWKAADYAGANNGFARLLVNNEPSAFVENINNDVHDVTGLNIGAQTLLDVGTIGTLYFDNLRYSDQIP